MEGDNPLTQSGMERHEKQKVIDEILESIHKGSLTKADLEKLSPASMYKRPIEQRIFVNRPLRLDTIDYFGFDMDYTLAIYTQEYEFLEYELAIEKLLQMGYPTSISELKYDPNYSIRGLFLDIETGNFLKIDNFGNISACVHGRVKIQKKHISEFYPSMRVHSDDIGTRFYLLNTLFTLPEACLYTDLVTHLEGISQLKKSDDVTIEDISYANLFHDVRYAIDYVHTDNGPLKKKTLEDIERYIVRTEKLSIFLHTLKQWKKQTFLLTNSPWYYTDKVMSYLLDGFNDQYASWMEYFDQVIVSAAKPAFFMKGTTLREVDKETGQLKIGHVTGKFQPGRVYQGGNMTLFEKLANVISGDRVLYTGDHIFADIIISKKKHGWRTLLVVPELRKELKVWKEVQPIYQRLLKLEYIKSEIYRGLDYSAKSQPDTTLIRKQMREALEELNNAYNPWFGGLFRSGLKLSFFGMQVQRYADLYTTDYFNILNYPMFYYYSPTPSLMQHEARHDDEHEMVF